MCFEKKNPFFIPVLFISVSCSLSQTALQCIFSQLHAACCIRPSMATRGKWVSYGIDSISRSGVATSSRVLHSKPSASQTSSGSSGLETGRQPGWYSCPLTPDTYRERRRECVLKVKWPRMSRGIEKRGGRAGEQTGGGFRKASCEGAYFTVQRGERETKRNATILQYHHLYFALLTAALCYLFPAVAYTLVWADTTPHTLVWAVSWGTNN